MPSFSGVMTATTGTNKTLATITGSTTIRGGVYQVTIGAGVSPADVGVEYRLLQTTAAGTNTAYTPNALDPTSAAAAMTMGNNHSVEPTYAANSDLLVMPVNQRAFGFWQAFTPDRLIWSKLAATNGLGFRSIQANGGTPIVTGSMFWTE